ncbi:MAG: hypothetical protein EO766_16705 [Hydrotalea sp. AMD]|uniref:hypothetical protein n=1 Tax=Hydrotalea sp. AMD TaxID=2501297 RepID=UPI0009458B00|nr:hypothetical protein [Hydrotalea sp. AMD]RWZ85508.1 MAG: hypothetical protein EO766_16705 [Hydrotalea sp. AMD]
MKQLYFIIFLLSFDICSAQVTFDKKVKEQYDAILDKCDNDVKKKAAKMETLDDYSGSYVFYTVFKIDTLNKSSLKINNYSDVSITNLDGSKIISKKTSFPFVDIDFCGVNFISKDSLSIQIGYPFSSKSISHSLYKNSISTKLNLYYKYDTILKSKLTDKKFVNNLDVKANTLHFTLSDSIFFENKYIYGFADIESEDFYIKDSYQENQILHLRYRMKYFFKFRKTKNST